MTLDRSKPAGGGHLWKTRLLAGDRVALGRAITVVENETAEAREVLPAIHGLLGRALVVGITGAPGVGKSTLVNAYIRELRKRGQSVGVIGIDPSSPLSGGAILGDRIRMAEHSGDEQVFVRSLASRGHLGGLSRTAERVVDVMDAARKDVIIVETVGTGQSEVEISEIAHTKVVVAAPGLGDEIQAMKAGILEIADIVVVNKNDLPHAERTAHQLAEAMAMSRREGPPVPVLRTTATTGEGVAALAEAIGGHAAQLPPDFRANGSIRRTRRLLAATVADRVQQRLASGPDARLDALCTAVQKGELDLEAAAELALSTFGWPAEKGDGE